MNPRVLCRRLWPALALGALGACGEVPEQTENARGVLEGAPLPVLLVLSVVFVGLAAGILVAAVGIDRWNRGRRAAAELPETVEEEDEPVVAGIGQGSAGVPRWLYAVYVIIPVWAVTYVLTNADVRSEIGPRETPSRTDGADGGPAGVPTEITLVAQNVQFDREEFTLQADAEVKITMDNRDTVDHNVAIYTTEAATEPIFVGALFGQGEHVYEFGSPPPGSYFFHCDVHPNMKGTANFAVPAAETRPAGGEEGVSEEPSTEASVVAENIAFDTDTLGFPAETEVTIDFDNQDAVDHNIAIYTTEAATEPIFVGDLITNDEITYRFTTPAAGEYFFHCDVHPNMKGTVVVT